MLITHCILDDFDGSNRFTARHMLCAVATKNVLALQHILSMLPFAFENNLEEHFRVTLNEFSLAYQQLRLYSVLKC